MVHIVHTNFMGEVWLDEIGKRTQQRETYASFLFFDRPWRREQFSQTLATQCRARGLKMPVQYRLLTEGADGNRQAVWSQAALKIPTGRIDSQMLRYLLAICIGAAAISAWQSYGAAIRQVIATRAPELGWSPETKQMIASAIQEVGWTTPANPEPPAPETVASKAPSATSLDPAQVQQIVQSLATLRQTVEQMAAGQDELKRDIVQMHSVLIDVLVKMPEPLRQPPAAAERKSVPAPPPSSRAPTASSRSPIPPQQ